MANGLVSYSKRHPLLVAAIVVCACAVTWLALWSAYTWVAWNSLLVEARSMDDAPRSGVEQLAVWSFAFQDATCTVNARVDCGDLRRAREIDTQRAFGTPLRLRADYLPRFVREQSESRFIDDLAEDFRRIREDMTLDDDEYLELMACAIQSIPYGEPKGDILLPIEVVADGRGVCSEKSVLLAALLVHEGYATAVFALPIQHHVAVGVKSDGAWFARTEYAFIETTRPALVGDVSSENRAMGPVHRPPIVMVVSDGIEYSSGAEVEYVLSRVRESLTPIEFNRRSYPALKTPGTYWALQDAQEQATTELAEFVLEHPHDRERVFRTVVVVDALAIGY